jgi:hypothetical protein
MSVRIAGLAMVLVCTVTAAKDRKPAEARGENESVVITAQLYSTPEQVKDVLGSDLGGHYIVVGLTVTPRFGKEVSISPDDFIMKTDKDGEKIAPFAPSEIAGRGGLVITQAGRGPVYPVPGSNNGPIWGGPVPGGVPGRLGTKNSGSGPAEPAESASGKVSSGVGQKQDPMEKVLKEKELPETKTDKPVSGLIYFPMEKQKVKDLELRYNPSDDKIVMRFHKES